MADRTGREFIEAVRRGEVPGVSIDPDDPALSYEPMDIYSAPGTRVRFMGLNGHDHERAEACKILEVGEVYTVAAVRVGGWASSVVLEEVPGRTFNTVMFADEDRDDD